MSAHRCNLQVWTPAERAELRPGVPSGGPRQEVERDSTRIRARRNGFPRLTVAPGWETRRLSTLKRPGVDSPRVATRITTLLATVTFTAACGASTPAQVAQWEPAPGVFVTAESQSLAIVVMEQGCSGGDRAEGRVEEPEVAYENDTVVVTVRVRSKPGFQDCPGNPPTCYQLVLDEPLGSRDLLMGGLGEPQTPNAGFFGAINCLN